MTKITYIEGAEEKQAQADAAMDRVEANRVYSSLKMLTDSQLRELMKICEELRMDPYAMSSLYEGIRGIR